MTVFMAARFRKGARLTCLAGVLVLALILLGGCDSPADYPPRIEPEVGTEPGNLAPPLTGTLADGSAFTFDPRSSSSTVLIFYRSADCGLCRLQLEQTQRHLPAYDHQGARVLGVTLDAPERSSALLQDVEVGFPLLSVDQDAFRRWAVLPENQPGPLPATFIVDRHGIVRYNHIGRNAADRSSDAGILTVLATLEDT